MKTRKEAAAARPNAVSREGYGQKRDEGMATAGGSGECGDWGKVCVADRNGRYVLYAE